MRLSIPHNWQGDLVESIDLTSVDGFYGKLDLDILGGGRSSNVCPHVTRGAFKKEIKKIHNKGLKFTYLLNATCLDNKELSYAMTRRLSKLLDWLADSGVDSITVSLPYIFGFIKKKYPDFKIYVSTMAEVESPDKARVWEDLGADTITLYEVTVNRNFELIRRIRDAVKCKLQLIANNGCLYGCPYTIYHSLLCSHSSQSGHILGNFAIDFYRIMCSYKRVLDPVNFIRADWIRPEDISLYEDLGIDSLKLVNRGMNTASLRKIVSAYTKGSYDGNLFDLMPTPSKNIVFSRPSIIYLLRYFFHPRLVNLFKLKDMKGIFQESGVYIDNRKLDNFLVSLQNKNCDKKLCNDCNYCREVAADAVKIDHRIVNETKAKLEKFIDELVSGSLFS
jgi:collagenase-like PrtC family protease